MSALQKSPSHQAVSLVRFGRRGDCRFYLCAFNGGPMFRFTEAVSFVMRCDSQAEVDEYWPQALCRQAASISAAASRTNSAFQASRARALERAAQSQRIRLRRVLLEDQAAIGAAKSE
jgi:hypothetical protein